MATRTLTIYLAKPDVERFDDVLSENARERLRDRTTQTIEINNFANGARLYIFVSPFVTPKWLSDLQRTFPINGPIQTRSACAVLCFQTAGRHFISTFSHGWMYLDEDNIEGDFGLRVALNILNDKKLRRIERANLGDALRGVSLSPFQREFNSFGLDDALDLVRKISGSANDGATANSVTGAHSLKLTGEFSLTDLPDLSAESLEHYDSVAYRNTTFRIIDHVTPVMDQRTVTFLDGLAVDSIRTDQGEFELGLPATSESEMIGYKFSGPGLRGIHPDLMMRNYVDALGDDLANLTPDTLRHHKICATFNVDGQPEKKWSIRTALIGSTTHEGHRYAINEGEWYQIDAAFRNSVEQNFRAVITQWQVPPAPLRKIYQVNGDGAYQTEASYNREFANAFGYCLLDTQLIEIPEIQRSGFEPCDILDIQGKRFIHVKKSSRRSSILSHFFKQGSNSAQQFSKFPAAWDALQQLVHRLHGPNAAAALNAVRDDERRWTVEFVIADTPRMNGEFNIPFFSKISLRDEVIDLHAMHYDVVLRFINLEN